MTADPTEPSRVTVSVSEMARNVAALVRRAEDGEEIVITRDGRPVASLGPHMKPNGAALIALFDSYGPDPEWADLIEEGRQVMWAKP
jgi:prevent-host-death family protein